MIYEDKITEINALLADLDWIETIHGEAVTGEDDQGTYPEYYNGTNVLRVLPEGNSISFIQIEGDITEVDEFHFNVPMSLTVWGDLRKINTTKKYDYTLELVKEVVDVLRSASCNDMEIKLMYVFSGFSYLEKKYQQNTMKPYFAFKISFNVLVPLCITPFPVTTLVSTVLTELNEITMTFSQGLASQTFEVADFSLLGVFEQHTSIVVNLNKIILNLPENAQSGDVYLVEFLGDEIIDVYGQSVPDFGVVNVDMSII